MHKKRRKGNRKEITAEPIHWKNRIPTAAPVIDAGAQIQYHKEMMMAFSGDLILPGDGTHHSGDATHHPADLILTGGLTRSREDPIPAG